MLVRRSMLLLILATVAINSYRGGTHTVLYLAIGMITKCTIMLCTTV